MKIIPVILAGGTGTRLWPLSREQHPKQFLNFFGKNTMLQETLLRLKGLNDAVDPIIICNTKHRFLVAEQCQQIKINNPTIILEPLGKNTAPAITAASFYALEKNNDTILLVLSADHVIKNIKIFHQAIKIAKLEAEQNKILTFGVVPTDANTGYGYIKICKKNNKNKFFKVEKVFEKPDVKSAKKYINEGNFLWKDIWYRHHCSAIPVRDTRSGREFHIYGKDIINTSKLSPKHSVLIDNNMYSFLACPFNGFLMPDFIDDASDQALLPLQNQLQIWQESINIGNDIRDELEIAGKHWRPQIQQMFGGGSKE